MGPLTPYALDPEAVAPVSQEELDNGMGLNSCSLDITHLLPLPLSPIPCSSCMPTQLLDHVTAPKWITKGNFADLLQMVGKGNSRGA